MVRRLRTIVFAGAAAVLAAAGLAVTAHVASADTTLCDQYAITTAGQYLVQNNRWGTSATQCINVTSDGFQIVQQDGSSANIGGRSWTVWTGNNGSNNVVSYVASSTISSWSFSVLDFLKDSINRGYATTAWYLTSIQAGFEPWSGGVGLAVNSFSAAVNGSAGGGGSTATATGGGGGSGSCQVSYATNVWTGGFTANVTVKNTGSTSLGNWALAFTLPSGQSISSSWNASLSASSGSITASNLSYNGSLPTGGSQSFGLQGTYSGSFAKPSSFSLNGTSCSVA